MNKKIGKFKYLLTSVILSVALIANITIYQNHWLGLIAGFFYLSYLSAITGRIFIREKAWQPLFGFWGVICIISIFTAGLIYGSKLNNLTISLIIGSLPAILFIPYYLTKTEENINLRSIVKNYFQNILHRREGKKNFFLVLTYLLLTAGGFFLMTKNQTAESIQSPWEVLNPNYLGLYFLASLILIFYLWSSKRTKLPLFLISIHYFLSDSLALIIYKIGYGFDPFIHRATEKIILSTGTINPKPLYYLGQYGLVIFLQKITLVDLALIDKFLVPTLFAIILPGTIFYVFSRWLQKNNSLLLALLGLSVPYGFFIMTAPQNFANLIFIVTILLAFIYYRNNLSLEYLALLNLATLAIHPLAGIPLSISLCLIYLFKRFYSTYHRTPSIYFITSTIFCLIMPLVFIINGNGLNFVYPQINLGSIHFFQLIEKNDLFINLTYLLSLNKIFWATLMIGLGFLYLHRQNIIKNSAGFLAAAGIMIVNYLVIKNFMTFPALRENDKTEFVGRLLLLSFYLLLPFYLLGFHYIFKKFLNHGFYYRFFVFFGLALILTISFYLSYPRLDSQEPSKFYSISESDIEAVNFIEQTAAIDHIVLANQMVGVAAIDQKGFKKYYNNQFYYSMPMGNPQTLYDLYLEMVYQGAKRETMEKAMVEADVSEAYFVINKYWRNFEKIVAQASDGADEIFQFNDGKIYIFKYSN